MKKSIAILGFFLMVLSHSCFQNVQNIRTEQKAVSMEVNTITSERFSAALPQFNLEEKGDPPRKDPWQWFQIFRRFWEF